MKSEIEEVVSKISRGYDSSDIDMLANLFTTDAVFTIEIREHGRVGPIEGREAIKKLHADSLQQQTDQRRHQITNLWIEKESDREVVAVSNLTLLSIEGGEINVISSGWYRDTLVRETGGWKIKGRYLYLDLPY